MTEEVMDTTTPEPPFMGQGREFKILAVDGGGFKGLYSACLLSEIEELHGPLYSHFDLLCGTSTGALIVLAIALGRPVSEVCDFYKNWGPKIFPENPLLRLHHFTTTRARYSPRGLRQATEAVFGSARIRDAKTLLCIPSFDVGSAAPRVFKTDHDSSLNRDNDLLMSEVALASASAPSYFPQAICEEKRGPVHYVDGGIWANNPSLVGLVEACRFFVGEGRPYNRVRILSIGNVTCGAGKLIGRRNPKLFELLSDMVTWTMEAQHQSIDYTLGFLTPMLRFPVEYVRISPRHISLEQSKGIGLDTASSAAIETLSSMGAREGAVWKSKPEIMPFFRDEHHTDA